MRRALACVVGVHPDEIEWIPPRRCGDQFWLRYKQEAFRLGYAMKLERWPESRRWVDVDKPRGLWIGIVRGRGRNTHAVVFDGERFHFGSQHRRRHPNKLFGVIRLEPVVNVTTDPLHDELSSVTNVTHHNPTNW